MPDYIELSRFVKLAPKPVTETEIDQFAQAGIRSVLDLRDDAAAHQSGLTPTAEAAKLTARGIDYVHLPLGGGPLDKSAMTRTREALEAATKPVLIHGGEDSRAGLLALVHTAIEAGLPGDHTVEMAHALDLDFSSPEERDTLVAYVDEQQARPDPFTRREQDVKHVTRLGPLLPEDVRTLRDEMREDHERELVLDHGAEPAGHNPHSVGGPAVPLPPPSREPVATTTVVLPRHRGGPHSLPVAALARPASVPLGAVLALLGLAVIALDRRLMVPLLIITGGYAGCALARRRNPSLPVPPPPPKPDREIADLEARIRRLSKVA